MKNKRLVSLDALRGFDMLFIMGFSGVIATFFNLFPSEVCQEIAHQMGHVPWDGLLHHDTIFPLFLFLAGVSFPFSFAKQQEKGMTNFEIHRKIIVRGLILVFLGCIYNGLLQFNFEHMRYASVLGRIGLAWMFAALIYVHCNKNVRIGIVLFLLIGYWLLLWFVPSPEAAEGCGPFSKEGCLVGYVDRYIVPGQLLYAGIHDPEGLLAVLPAIGTALLGMFAGELVRSEKKELTPSKKAGILAITGIILGIIAYVWNFVFPINKNLWSSSFVCAVGSYSFLMFALFFYLIDVKGWKGWTTFFSVIGMNSITIYMAQRFIDFTRISQFFLGGVSTLFPEQITPLIIQIGYVASCWLFLYFLYKKGIFLKV